MEHRDGFTIVEVILSLVLLSFVIMGFQAATSQIIHYAAQGDRLTVAAQLAEDRLELIRLDPRYETLIERYAGEEPELDGFPGLVRTTAIERTRAEQEYGVLDYHVITVTVDGNGLRTPAARTLVVAAP